ncbi:MAG: RsmE family RNA methyltransferase [Candidatus Buchananbacteria bacterium]
MQRFYIPLQNFRDDYAVSDSEILIKQLTNVLRAKEGDKFLLFNNSGWEYLGQLIKLTKTEARFLLIDQKPGLREPERRVTLYQSLLKADKFEWLLQKATEIGVTKIVPIVSERSVVREVRPPKLERFREIAREASEQCGAVVLTEVLPALSFSQALQILGREGGIRLIAYEGEENRPLENHLEEKINLFVGPEGGWSTEEIILAQEAGCLTVTLGRRILRAETAALAALVRLIQD